MATLMEDKMADKMVNRVTEMMNNKLSEQLDRAEKAAEYIEQVVARVQETAAETEKTWDNMKTAMEDAGRAIKDATEDVATVMRDLQGEGGQNSGESGTQEEGTERTKRSYADAMKAVPPQHINAIARTELLKRQVVLQRDAGADNNMFKDLTEREILEKVKIVVEMMGTTDDNMVEGIDFLHAKRTTNSRVVLMLKTVETVTWLRHLVTLRKFAEKMGGTTTASATLYMVVAEYVPVAYSPEGYKAHAKIEEDSGLRRGAIQEARYIKKIEWRAQGQRSAHVMMGLTDPEQANKAIRDGIVVEGKKVMVRRHRMDPKRCMKCQAIRVNHQAAECKSIHDTCRRCAGMHRTNDCTVDDIRKFKCANCKEQGHGAADHNCKIFREKTRELHMRFTTYAYRFFPTSNLTTWEKTEEMMEQGEQGGRDNGWSQVGRTRGRRGEQRGGVHMGLREHMGQGPLLMQPKGWEPWDRNVGGSRPASRQARMNEF
jgi:hypothetical protein